MDVNMTFFRRLAPKKKLELAKSATKEDLLRIKEETLIKMVNRAGIQNYGYKDKELHIATSDRAGNNWNSDVTGIEIYKNSILMSGTIAYDNTDTCVTFMFSKFMSDNFMVAVKRDDRYGNTSWHYGKYDETDKAEVIRSIIITYIKNKYNETI